MGRKSKKKEKFIPFCYYCDREFIDESQLILHQKLKHFKCESCGKKMTTSDALRVHMAQVHKETLRAVPNAIEGRRSIDMVVFGMEGVPAELVEEFQNSKRRKINEDGTIISGTNTSSHSHPLTSGESTVNRFFYQQQEPYLNSNSASSLYQQQQQQSGFPPFTLGSSTTVSTSTSASAPLSLPLMPYGMQSQTSLQSSFHPSSSSIPTMPTPPAHLMSMMLNMITGGGPRPPSSIQTSTSISTTTTTAAADDSSNRSVQPFLMIPSGGPRPFLAMSAGNSTSGVGGSKEKLTSVAVIDPHESSAEAAIESAVAAATLISASLHSGTSTSSSSSSSTSSSTSSTLISSTTDLPKQHQQHEIPTSSSSSFSTTTTPQQPSWASLPPPPIPQGSKLVWANEMLSPEEVRATIPRFAFDAKAFEMDVESRLRAILGE
jgi:hypothetical protein